MCNIKPVTQNNTLKIVKQALDGNYVAIKCSQMDQLDTFGEKNNIWNNSFPTNLFHFSQALWHK